MGLTVLKGEGTAPQDAQDRAMLPSLLLEWHFITRMEEIAWELAERPEIKGDPTRRAKLQRTGSILKSNRNRVCNCIAMVGGTTRWVEVGPGYEENQPTLQLILALDLPADTHAAVKALAGMLRSAVGRQHVIARTARLNWEAGGGSAIAWALELSSGESEGLADDVTRVVYLMNPNP